jgi:hypothetical protein
VAIGVTGGLPGVALAQTDEQRSAARAAATEGLQALSEGRYKEALDLCTRAESLMHAPTHLLLIARAQTKLGHLVEAQEAYIRISRDALAPDAPRAFVEAQRTATEEETELAPRVPSLKVNIEGATPQQARVTLDGTPMAPALVGLAMPINPGTYTLAATGPGLEASPVTVTVGEGAKQTVLLSLKGAAAPAVVEAAPSVAETPAAQGHGGEKAAGWISLAVGVAGLAAGTVFLVMNHSEESSADGSCNPSHCPDSVKPTITSDENSASTDATLAWIGYSVGAVGVIVGGALLWAGTRSSSPSSDQPAATATFVPVVGPRSAGFRIVF